MIAHQVGGKTTRDTLFFSTFHVHILAQIVIALVVPTIALAFLAPRVFGRIGPARAVTWAYLASAALHLAEWGLVLLHRDRPAALILYVHISLVPVLTSGFWAVLGEGSDPRENRRQMARAALAACLGGVFGGVLARIIGVAAMLPVLAALHAGCAAASNRLGAAHLAGASGATRRTVSKPERARAPSGRAPASTRRYLASLAIAVALLAMAAALVDYVFKGQVQVSFTSQRQKLEVFSNFYTLTAVLALLVQVLFARGAIQRFGLVPTAATLPFGLTLGSLGAILFPGLASAGIARATEVVTRNSLFRSAYEPLFNAVPAREKNAAKTIVDVGFERVGDAVGYGAAWALPALGGQASGRPQLLLALCLSAGVLVLARYLDAGYRRSLRENLDRDPGSIDPSTVLDLETTRILLESKGGVMRPPAASTSLDLAAQIAALSSGDERQIRRALEGTAPISTRLVHHAIPLLARSDVAGLVVAVLRRVAPRCTGQLIDSLLDPQLDLAVRRRIPRVLVACPNDRGVGGLLAGLEDARFEIRLQCGRALVRMREGHPGLHVDEKTVFARVSREMEVERPVWVAQQIVEDRSDQVESRLIDDKLRLRVNHSLEHVFNLLALVLPEEPLQQAFRALHTGDRLARGKALEYLDTILPRDVRDRLWSALEPEGRPAHSMESQEVALAALRRLHESVEISLSELQKRGDLPPGGPPK
jgi:hypothetical protein